MTHDEMKEMLEEAGKTLMMLPLQGTPAGYRSNWPAEPIRSWEEFFAAQVQADADIREELLAGRNNVRVRAQQGQIDNMDKCLRLVYSLEDPKLRAVVFARMLKHPVSDRHIVSFAKLGRQFGMHRNTIIDWYKTALNLLAKRAKSCM